MKKRNKKGFTLIELIVVIAILVILAAILVPTILGFINDANEAADIANAKMLYNGGAMWGAKNGTPAANIIFTEAAGDVAGSLAFNAVPAGYDTALSTYVGNNWPITKVTPTGVVSVTITTGNDIIVVLGGRTYDPAEGDFS